MNKIVILGHGFGVKQIIETIQSKKFLNYEIAAVITHPFCDHERDLNMIKENKAIYGDFEYNIFNIKRDYNVDLWVFENVNDISCINKIKEYNAQLIISVGCRNIIKKTFLDTFKSKVVNLHTTPLPRYRGAASDSWMILNGEWGKELFGVAHYIDEGIDTGDIIAKENYLVPNKAYPIDVYKARMSIFPELLIKLIESFEDKSFIPTKQANAEATVFPRLYTPVDGQLDLKNMNGAELEKMIYAFSYPFEGAFVYSNSTKINIKEARYIETAICPHYKMLGMIFSKENSFYKVFVKNGYLEINKMCVDGEVVPQSKYLKLGKYLS